MSRRPSSFRRNPFRWAAIPLFVASVMLGWVALRPSNEGDGPVAVTALKPIAAAGDDEEESGSGSPVAGAAEELPIEVRYGVPSPRTARLWSEPRPG